MNHDEHRKLQQEIIEQVLAILKKDERVLGVVFAGSYARGEYDAFSDLDLACYLRDEERSGRGDLYEQVAQIAPTLWYLYIYDVNALYLFENGVRLDLDFCKPSALNGPSQVYTDVRIAYDPDGVLSEAFSKPRPPQPPQHPKWFEPGDPAMIDWFFWMYRQVVCWAKRGAQDDHRAFEKLANAVNSLADVRARLVEMRLWTLGSSDYVRRADPGLAEILAQTYPHFDPDDIIECTRRLLDAYELVCPPYCQKTGAVFPARKVQVMRGLIEEYNRLE
jgi:predicted nucleotidyltransferase